MTDYLERALREDVDALLEAERRLAAALLPLRAEGESSAGWENSAPGQARAALSDEEARVSSSAGEAQAAPAGREAQAVPADRERRSVPAAGQALWELVWPAESVRLTARARQGREALSEGELNGGVSASGVPRTEAAARPALLEQLERTERAVSAGLTAAGAGSRSGSPALPSLPAGRRTAEGDFQTAAEPPDTAAGGLERSVSSRWTEEDLAARVDRSFQRDARRYDNGFFLY